MNWRTRGPQLSRSRSCPNCGHTLSRLVETCVNDGKVTKIRSVDAGDAQQGLGICSACRRPFLAAGAGVLRTVDEATLTPKVRAALDAHHRLLDREQGAVLPRPVTCPTCQRTLTTAVEVGRRPLSFEPGTVGVCGVCGSLMVVKDDGTMRQATAAEDLEHSVDPMIAHTREGVAELNRRKGRGIA